jgi:hypothetical protein
VLAGVGEKAEEVEVEEVGVHLHVEEAEGVGVEGVGVHLHVQEAEEVGVLKEMRKRRDERVVEEEEGRICRKLGKGNNKAKKTEHGPTCEHDVVLSERRVLRYRDGEQC